MKLIILGIIMMLNYPIILLGAIILFLLGHPMYVDRSIETLLWVFSILGCGVTMLGMINIFDKNPVKR